MFFFFFFQAEDGIRDYKVTGVQTCALPIYIILSHTSRNPANHGGVAMRIGRKSGSLALVLMVVACERSPETITGNAPRPSMATATAAATNPQATIGINVLLKGPATAGQLAGLNTLGTVTD